MNSLLDVDDALEQLRLALAPASSEVSAPPRGLSWLSRATLRHRLARVVRDTFLREAERSVVAQADSADLAPVLRALNQVLGLRLAYERLFDPVPAAVATVLDHQETKIVAGYVRGAAGSTSTKAGADAPPLAAFSLTRAELEELRAQIAATRQP